jgi:glycosyltransferase involved in cell wall biosynthesis
MAKTVLIIAYYFPPMGMGGAQRMSKLARYLPGLGYNVKVLTVKPVRYPAYDKTLREELPEGVEIFCSGSTDPARIAKFIPFPIRVGPGLKSAAKNKERFWPDSKIGWKQCALKLGQKIIRENRIDMLLSSSPPITGHLIAMELKSRFNLPWVADFRDIWESRSPEQLYNDKNLIDKSNRLLEEIARKADAVTGVNDTIVTRLSSRGVTIAGGYDPDDFAALTIPKSRDRFILCYLGTIGSLHPIEPYFDAARTAANSNTSFASRIYFKIIGANDKKAVLKSAGKSNLQGRVELIGYRPHRAALQEAAAASVMLLSLPKDYPDVMPGKVFDCLALPAPILASVPAGGEAEKIIDEYRGGICIEPDNPDILAEKMLLLFQHHQDGIVWKKSDLSGLTRRETARRFADVFDRITRDG